MLPIWEEHLLQLSIKILVKNNKSPVQVKNSVSVYIDRDSDRDSARDRDKNDREKNYIDRDRDAR